jgi:hypothetical protein
MGLSQVLTSPNYRSILSVTSAAGFHQRRIFDCAKIEIQGRTRQHARPSPGSCGWMKNPVRFVGYTPGYIAPFLSSSNPLESVKTEQRVEIHAITELIVFCGILDFGLFRLKIQWNLVPCRFDSDLRHQ